MKFQNIVLGLAATACTAAVVHAEEEDGSPFILDEQNANIFQGDIIAEYHEIEEMFGEETAKAALENNAVSFDDTIDANRRLGAPDPNKRFLWKGGRIPYYVDNSFNAEDKEKIQRATEILSDRTGLTFIESRSQGHYIRFNSNSNGCSSAVGKQGGGSQSLNLKRPAFEGDPHCMHVGTIAHEFMHALGLWHEQSMKDRDNYVKILFDNIPSNKRFNFNKITTTHDLGVKYAYNSLMHYSSKAFGDGKTTIQAVDGRGGPVNEENTLKLGNRDDLDPSDALQLRIMYHCAIENPDKDPNSGDTYFVKRLETLCSPECPCHHGQGNCNNDSDCHSGLKCTTGIGRYTYLVNDVVEIPTSYGVCIDPDLPPSKAPTRSPSLPPTPLPTIATNPTECECKNNGGQFEQCEFYQPLSNNVCIIKSDKPESIKPDCDLPEGARLAYSSSRTNWYMVGCIPEDEAAARQYEETLASFDFPVGDEPVKTADAGGDLAVVAVGSAFGGALLVAGALLVYRKSQGGATTTALAAGEDPFSGFRVEGSGPFESNGAKL